jgi:phospholysine phosphohistidine inorganic pyrophosphate phosphatase
MSDDVRDASWLSRPINGVLLDITGVLYNSGSGDGEAIAGSIDAVER